MPSVKVALNRARKLADKGEKLIKDLKDEPNKINVNDIYLPLNHLFNQAAKRAFERKVDNTVTEREVKMLTTTKAKEIDQVRFFGAKAVGERKIFDAAQKVANQINHYADKGLITGVMGNCKLMMIQLATEPFQLEQWIVMSYVALSPYGIDYLKSNPTKIEFEVGGVPLNSDDL